MPEGLNPNVTAILNELWYDTEGHQIERTPPLSPYPIRAVLRHVEARGQPSVVEAHSTPVIAVLGMGLRTGVDFY